VVTAQLPGGSIDLTENAFTPLPECKLKTRTGYSVSSVHDEIYSIPSCLPNHPRYCFILARHLESGEGKDWGILELEIDLSIPGPVKTFSRVSRQYTVAPPTDSNLAHHNVDDLLLSADGSVYLRPLKVGFLQVGKPDVWQEVTLGGVDKIYLVRLHVDRDAGYITAFGSGCMNRRSWECSYIWWIDVRKPGAVVQRRTYYLDGVMDCWSAMTHHPMTYFVWSILFLFCTM